MNGLSPLADISTATSRVLHVDDEPDLAELTATYLERKDDQLEVETATSASEGLERLSETDFDCIISDYDMPGQNGIEFLETVRDEYPDLPFILYTGKGSEEVASEAISAGVTDYLQKASGTDQYTVLANRVSNAIDQYRSRRMIERSEHRLREIIDAVPHILYVVDEDGRYLLANDTLAEFHGMTVDALEGAAVETVLAESAADQFDADLRAVLDSDTPKPLSEIELVNAAGESHILEPRLLPYESDETDTDAVLGVAVDVTDRQQRERELERIRSRMHLTLDCTDSVLFEIDLETGRVIRHGAFEQFFGRTPAEVPTWEDHLEVAVHPADRERTRQFYQQVIDGERESGTLEYRTNPEDGHTRWIRDTLSVERDTPDGTAHALGIARDVTEHKERELELQRKERRYHAVFNDPNILVGLIDIDGTVLDINQTAMDYVDVTLDDIAGTPLWKTPWFAHSESLQTDVQDWIERAASGEYVEFEADLVRPDGEPYTVAGVIRPVTNSEGEVVSLLISDRDVTEHKERKRALKQERDRFRAIFEKSFDTMLIANDDGEFIDANESATDLLGVSRDELLGRSIAEFATDDFDFGAAWQEFRDSEAERGTFPLVRADGTERTVEYTATTDIVPGQHLSILRDVTEQKQAKQRLKKEQQFVQSIFDALPDPLYAFDTEGHPIRWNERLEEVTGYTTDEIAAMDVTDFFPDDEAETIATEFQAVLAERKPATVESAVETKDGDRIPYEFTGGPLHDADGNLRGITGIGRELTTRKEHERRLTALNEVAHDLMTAESREEVVEIGVTAARDVLRLDANAIHLYDDEQSALVPVTQTAAGEVLIGDPPTFTGGDSIAWRVYERGEPLALDDVHDDPDIYNPDTELQSELFLPLDGHGILIAASDTLNTFDQQDTVLGEILASTIAEALEQVARTDRLRKRDQELRRQNERLEEFAGVVSHDLRNPLQVAQGRLELLREECDSEHLDPIENALQRSDQIIEDVLGLAREGRDIGSMDAVALRETVDAAWDLAADNLEHAALRYENGAESLSPIVADGDRLQQLLENLLRNAIEHGGEDVTITVGELADGFYVEDTGPGIPEAERDDVFVAGYSTSNEGTGFGLAIVKRVAEAHGWEINVTEASSGGARFEITGVEFVTE